MKILFICHRFPYPPRRGGKIRPFNIIRHLHTEHEVTVASLTRSDSETEEAQGIRPYCSHYIAIQTKKFWQNLRVVGCLPTPVPSSMGYFYSSILNREIQRLLGTKSFDLIFAHCSSIAPYVSEVKGIPKILDYGDIDSQKWLVYAKYRSFPFSTGFWLEGQKLMRKEVQFSRQFDLCTTTTVAEHQTLLELSPTVEADWFPNGVDVNYFNLADEKYDPNTICFVGRMDYYPNQECMFDFCSNTFPLIRKQVPGAKLLIVGAAPSQAVRQLADGESVIVTGSVPDVRPYLRRSALAVAPLNIVRGTQNKILEAMALGIPVVCSEGALRGVDAHNNEHLLARSRPQEYAEAIIRVMTDHQERQRLSKAGRNRILSHHLWSTSMKRLDGIIQHCRDRYSRQSHQTQGVQGAKA